MVHSVICLRCDRKHCKDCVHGSRFQEREKPMSNFEYMKTTNIEDVAFMICYCMDNLVGYDEVLNWLESEVE